MRKRRAGDRGTGEERVGPCARWRRRRGAQRQELLRESVLEL